MSDYPEVPEVDVHEAKRRVEAGAYFIDVREPDEYQEARIPGAHLLPLSSFATRYQAELPKEREIVVHCRSGRCSSQVTEFLLEHGYQAVNVGGGILAWGEEELPLERG